MNKSISGFDKWGLEGFISDAIIERGWKEPTEIQIESIPHARKGRISLVRLELGLGKPRIWDTYLREMLPNWKYPSNSSMPH